MVHHHHHHHHHEGGQQSNKGKVNLIYNSAYKASGPRSYVGLLYKYNIDPTLEGPYFRARQMHQQGKFGAGVGGRATIRAAGLQKKDPTTGQSGEVPAVDIQNDSEYLVEVAIGTPAQNLYLDFDTGSSDLWVKSTELPSNEQTSTGQYAGLFDSSKSTSFKSSSGSTWTIQYGDSSTASGNVGTDVLTIGSITIQNQAIELAESISAQFASGSGSGLLGLAWPSINTVQPTPVATPVENMISQGLIPSTSSLFTAYLTNSKDTSTPFYTFGYIDQTASGGQEPTYTPVDNSQGFWQFASASYSINGTTTQVSGNTAIADTGTTLALVSDDVVKAIYAAIPGSTYDSTQQGYLFPTTTSIDSLPDVAFAVGDQLFHVQKEDLAFSDAGNGMTYGGIQSRGSMTFDILGDTFLKGIYAVFDQGNKQFGAIQRTAGTTSSSTSTSAPTSSAPGTTSSSSKY